MKSRFQIPFSLFLIVVFVIFNFIFNISARSQNMTKLVELDNNTNPDFYQIKQAYEEYFNSIPKEDQKGWKQFKRWENFWGPRVYPDGKFPNASKVLNEVNSYNLKNSKIKENIKEKNKDNILSQNQPQWSLLGPERIPTSLNNERGQGLGRINIVRFNPSNPDEIWVGAASGGVWRSLDKGTTWTDFPFTQFLSIGVSDIAISESNPDIVYVSTGDSDPSSGRDYYSIGIIKTTDAGDTWNTTNFNFELSNAKLIPRLLVHPQNPDIVLAAASDGIYKTTDGGLSWEKKASGGYFKDMKWMPDPNNPMVVYATTFAWSGSTGIYKSTDQGETWNIIAQFNDIIRTALAVTPEAPDLLWALCADKNRAFHSIKFTDDQGLTWKDQSSYAKDTLNYLGWYKGNNSGDRKKGQGEYDLALAVNNNDLSNVYLGGVDIWKSTDQGTVWNLITHWWGSYSLPFVHADIHDLQFHPVTGELYATSDGGLDVSTDNGASWKNLTNGISISQFYRLGCTESETDVIVAGAQDNGSSMYKNGTWYHILSADGMEAIVDPINENIVYASIYNGSISKSTNGGVNFNQILSENKTGEKGAWLTPYVLNPSNSQTIYAGFNNVWKSTDGGANWTNLKGLGGESLINLAVAPSDSNYIYAGTTSTLWASTDGGTSWNRILSSSKAITYITIDPKDATHLWISYSGYTADAKVWEFRNSTWINLSGNLPNVPVNCIIVQKDSPDRLYIGTDVGVFYSDYNSGVWTQYGFGLSNIVIYELDIRYRSNLLRAATFGRGIWEAPLTNCILPEIPISVTGQLDLCPGDSVTLEAISDNSNIVWTTGETTKKITINTTGTYSCFYEDTSGCTPRSKAIVITQKNLPDLRIIPVGKKCLCEESDSVILSTGYGFRKFNWSTGDTTRKITVTVPGNYFVDVISNDTCDFTIGPFTVKKTNNPGKPAISQDVNWLISTPSAGYQWYLDSLKLPVSATQSILAKQTGIYRVEITDSNGCKSMSDPFNFLLDIPETSSNFNEISIFPNPSENIFYLSYNCPQTTEITLEIQNILGIKVYENKVLCENNSMTSTLDLTSQPSGVYYVILRDSHTGKNIELKKIIKK